MIEGVDWQDIQPEGIRLAMARRMELSRLIPHFYLQRRMDATALVAGAKAGQMSIDDAVVLGCARALRLHPELNATWNDGVIRRFASVHIGLAVATDRGLFVPVIHGADTLDPGALRAERERLVTAVRARTARSGDLEGGTFTVTNVGRLGVDHGWPLINPPQVGILAIGRVANSPVVRDGMIVAVPTIDMTLAADHRAVDGAQGAAFLATLAATIEGDA